MSKLVSQISLIPPAVIQEFNNLLENGKFLAATILFKQMEEQYNHLQLNALIKLVYLKHVGINHKIVNFMHQEFSKYNVFHPYSDKCYFWSTKNHEMEEIYKQEEITNILKPREFVHLSIDGENKIPLISHYVWVTNSLLDQAGRTSKFWEHNKYLADKIKLLPNYQHIMWTSSLELIPDSVSKKLSEMGIELRSLDDLYQASKDHPNNQQLEFLLNLAQIAAELSFYAISTDIIRYQALKEFGGIYSDGDYKLYQDPQSLFKDFEAVIGYESSSVPASFNGFYAVKEQHPIMLEYQWRVSSFLSQICLHTI